MRNLFIKDIPIILFGLLTYFPQGPFLLWTSIVAAMVECIVYHNADDFDLMPSVFVRKRFDRLP